MENQIWPAASGTATRSPAAGAAIPGGRARTATMLWRMAMASHVGGSGVVQSLRDGGVATGQAPVPVRGVCAQPSGPPGMHVSQSVVVVTVGNPPNKSQTRSHTLSKPFSLSESQVMERLSWRSKLEALILFGYFSLLISVLFVRTNSVGSILLRIFQGCHRDEEH